MDVAEWLGQLRLERYAAAFHDNAITPEVLAGLTADDLKELGVGLVGHRRLLLDAIAKLGDGPARPQRRRLPPNRPPSPSRTRPSGGR